MHYRVRELLRPYNWIMCDGYVYTDAEIQQWKRLGWLRTDVPRDRFGRQRTTPGEEIDVALVMAPAYDSTDWDE